MSTEGQEKFSAWLRVMLDKHSLVQSHAARHIGIPQSSFNGYCTGRTPCGEEHRKKIESYFEKLEQNKNALVIQQKERKETDLAAVLHVPGLDDILDRGIIQAVIGQTAETLGIDPGGLIFYTGALFKTCKERGVSPERLIQVVMSMAAPKSE